MESTIAIFTDKEPFVTRILQALYEENCRDLKKTILKTEILDKLKSFNEKKIVSFDCSKTITILKSREDYQNEFSWEDAEFFAIYSNSIYSTDFSSKKPM